MEAKTLCTCTAIRHAAQTLTELYDRLLAPSGLKITQYMLLQSILGGETEKSITQLAQEVDMDRSTIGRNLHILARDGFVSLGAGSDRREHVVRITEKGHQALASALPLWENAQELMVKTLGRDQLDTLKTLLARLETADS